MKDNNLEYLLTAIKRSQDKYVHSQIDLFDRILVQVKKQYENAMSATMCNEVAIAIYQDISCQILKMRLETDSLNDNFRR